MSNYQQQQMGVGQMLPQQQQQRQQQQPQRGQQPNPQAAQIQSLIFQTLNTQTGPLSGWQANVLIQERMSTVFNIIGNLRLASLHQPQPPTLNKMIEIGIKFEKEIFEKSPDKATYKSEVQMKLDQLLARRAENQQNLQQSINMQAQAQAQQVQQAQQVAHNQQMMQQNGMQNQVPRNMPQQPAQQPYHHLAHQMQPSSLPGQQNQPLQMPIGMPNDGMPPNQQQQFNMAMAQAQQQQQQSQNGPGRPQQGQGPPLSQQEQTLATEMAQKMLSNASDQEKNTLRASVQARMDPGTFQKYQSQGLDPLLLFYRNQAMQRMRGEKQQRMAQAQAAQLAQQRGQNVPGGAAPIQHPRSMNPSPLNGGQTQPPASMGGDMGSFIGNMGSLMDQQQQGVLAQEAGHMVVPVSGAPRNTTPQPGMPGQHANLNGQRPGLNANAGGQRQPQQMFENHSAQATQERLQFAARAQQAQDARVAAQAKAQQLALQGQPGGMSSGPMPPQQSPAMGTLNTPLRNPAQPNQPDASQMGLNAQFGQPIDPRSTQANQRQPGPGNAMNMTVNDIFNTMPLEMQARIGGMPQEKVNEICRRWQVGRMAGQSTNPMQNNPQMRPGSIPQQGQFNPQNAGNQAAIGNAGQRPPQPGMAPGMTAQQQQIALREQQMHRFQQQQQQQQQQQHNSGLQQRNGAGSGPNDQRVLQQMDGMEFPPQVYSHPAMPRGIPQDVKKWGPLKQWAQNNPNVPPEQVESIKAFQRLHYQNLVKKQQGGGGLGMQPGNQGGNMPMIPPGMQAPVAPMGSNPLQPGNGMAPGQLRIPTPLDIQQARNSSNGKFAQATDDQIRNFLMRHSAAQLTPQQRQQQQRDQFLQLQLGGQLGQGQQRPSVPPIQGPQNSNAMGSKSLQQSHQPQIASESNAPSANNPRGSRPPPNGRPNPQNSSPAQQAKSNLKRASSDDVVEVPNPNTQQQRAVAEPPQSSTPQSFRQLTPQQLSSLDPEARRKYEYALQMWKKNGGGQPHTEEIQRLRVIMQEETARSREILPDIPMDAETKASMANLLRQINLPLSNVGKAILRWHREIRDENRARAFFRTRHRIAKQYKDPDKMTELKDVFSIRPAELDQARLMLSLMVKDLTIKFPEMKKESSTQGHPGPVPQANATGHQPAAAPTVPLNAANLQEQQHQLNKMHQRQGSRSSQTPAAPTSTQPPFPFGASSPHGTPAYIGKNTVTHENLHIPARKKQKPNNNGQITPGAAQVNKVPSPEIRKQPAPESRPQPRPALCCSEPDCDRHNVGFDSEEALRAHTQEEHIQPLENPTKYALDSLMNLMGVDAQGRPKNSTSALEAGAVMESNGLKQGQTPKTGNTPGGATPMNRQGSVTGIKPNVRGVADSTKDPVTKLPAGQKASPKPATHVQETTAVDPWANATIDPNDLFQNFQGFESGAGGAISDMNVYRSLTPNDTPESSKDGISEPNSDISDGVGLDISLDIFDDNWQPFGPSEFDVMDGFNFSNDSGEDLLTFDEDKPVPNTQTWDDLLDTTAFDKPFVFDSSKYSMSTE